MGVLPDPRVLYECHHHETNAEADAQETSLVGVSLAHLYFCADCQRLCCSSCTTNETACFFCPRCLFEVPSAYVRSASGVSECSRNCLDCPSCFSSLSVLEDSTSTDISSSSESKDKDQLEKKYFFECHYCHWNSKKSVGLLSKPSGMARQLQDQNTQNSPVQKEFQRAVSLMQDLVWSLENGSSRRLKKSALVVQTPLEPVSLDDSCTVPDILEVDFDTVTTLEERLAQPEYQPYTRSHLKPLGTSLSTKTTRQCPDCRLVLIQPEPKAASSQFLIRHCAIDSLPNISLIPSRDSPRILHLQFENPSTVSSMSIRLGLDGTNSKFKLEGKQEDGWVLVDPQFTLSPKGKGTANGSAPVLLSKKDSDVVIVKNAGLIPLRWTSAVLPTPSEITLIVSCALDAEDKDKSITFRVRVCLNG